MSQALSAIGERSRSEGLDIGLVAMGYPPDVGGIETHLSQLAREWTARRHRVHVLCLDSRSGGAPYSFRDEQHEGARVRRVAYRYHDHRALADLAVRGAANDVVMAWLAEEPCDVVHVHHATGFGAGALGAIRDMGRPLCVTLHDYWFLCPRGQMWRHDGVVCAAPEPAACGACLAATWPHLMPSAGGEPRGPRGAALHTDAEAAAARTGHALEMLAQADRLFAPSAAARDVFERAGVPKGRIHVVANGIELDLAARAESARKVAQESARGERGALRIGVLGSAQPSKGVLEFARAALSLDERALSIEVHGPLADYHGDASYAERLRALARQDPRLVLAGAFAHADLPRILAGLDAVAVPSLWNEVFGLTAREARAAGIPVLASDRGGLAELSGDPGVRLLPPEDPAAWRAAVAELLSAPRGRRAAAGDLRSVHALALELERHYVELARTLLGREPVLAFEPGGDRESVRRETGERAGAWTRIWRRLRG